MNQNVFTISLMLVVLLLNWTQSQQKFPDHFKFGVATSAYQIEGGWNESGKGLNIWDVLTHTNPEKIADNSTGDMACDSYHIWQRDIEMLTELNVDFYRFSISWSRILPTGQSSVVNEAGVDYYNDLINALHRNGIHPMVTLYHMDLPQALQDLGGWTNPAIADYFADYARVCFELFGDRVNMWLTISEPLRFCHEFYETGNGAPGISSPVIGPYLCGKTVLLAHAKAFRLYDEKYRESQQGLVSIALDVPWYIPLTSCTDDKQAAERAMQMFLGWFAHPIYSKCGDYPDIMKERILNVSLSENYNRSRLPPLTKEEVKLICGTHDFFALNHFTAFQVAHYEHNSSEPSSVMKDSGIKVSQDAAWPTSESDWMRLVPDGFRQLLNWIKNEYGDEEIVVTGNGYGDNGTLKDMDRINYYRAYLTNLLSAMCEDKVNVVAFTAWSLMDSMEWAEGYTIKYGLYHVDFESPNRTRTMKMSFYFYQSIINDKIIPPECMNTELETNYTMNGAGNTTENATDSTNK